MNWCKFIDQTDDLSQKRDKVKEILSKMQECGRNCQNVGEMWENSAKCGKCGNVGGLYGLNKWKGCRHSTSGRELNNMTTPMFDEQ